VKEIFMGCPERSDDFPTRRALESMSMSSARIFLDARRKLVAPLIEEARTHRRRRSSSVPAHGFSSLEAKPLVEHMAAKGLLGHGAGRLVLKLAQAKGITIREAGSALLAGRYWEELPR
jgi:D-ornithine 4,5-aminomutase subunit alpha